MKKTNLMLVKASLACFALLACTLFAMYFIEIDGSGSIGISGVVCGACLWLFLILGVVLQIVVSARVKYWCKENEIQKTKFKRPIGLIRFCSNGSAMISDVALGLSIVAFTITCIFAPAHMTAFLSLALLVLSFSAHCILNGRNYYYIINNEYIMTQLKNRRESK